MVDHLHDDTINALDDEPVVMLNLMRFRTDSLDGDGTGWDAYLRYRRMANALIRQRGGRIMWAGFADMMHSADYAEANVHRDNGCEDHLIMAVDETYNGLAR